MTQEQAIDWLQQVGGELYCSRQTAPGSSAWVAVVRTPWQGARRGKLIIALGATLQEAAAAAEHQWQQVWRDLSGAPS
jgi:hypothetical protein